MNDKNRINMKVIGDHTIHCAGCERSIEFALSQFPEVQRAKSDWRTQAIEIDLKEDDVDFGRIKEELAWMGYEVEVV